MWFLRVNKIKTIEYHIKKTKIIGFLSTSQSVGLTHFVGMLYSYLKDFHGKRMVWVTYDEAFMEFCRQNTKKELARDVFFGLSYQEMVALKDMEMDYILVDYGHELSRFREDFLRSDIRVLMGSLSLWQRNPFLLYLSHEQSSILHSMQVFYHFGEQNTAKTLRRKLCPQLKHVPFCVDPFYLKKETVKEMATWDGIWEI